jgi:hypothetical protein
MTLYDKIRAIYSTLTEADFSPFGGTIMLQNDSDGRGDYIREWKHATLAEPTQAQLDAVKEPK